jgi:hypothetical protein
MDVRNVMYAINENTNEARLFSQQMGCLEGGGAFTKRSLENFGGKIVTATELKISWLPEGWLRG